LSFVIIKTLSGDLIISRDFGPSNIQHVFYYLEKSIFFLVQPHYKSIKVLVTLHDLKKKLAIKMKNKV